ncbi:T9SS type A sorting domain-containing protein [bacterium SCSIO 12741]|nr:T9SS type A sorting domain-containing protein [bacterium SCSIO 12741]
MNLKITCCTLVLFAFGYAQGQNFHIDDYLNDPQGITFTKIGVQADGLDSPVDLDYNPNQPDEWWVINMRTENTGGSTVTYQNVGGSNQKAIFKVDGNAWHFMSLPTALAFGTNGSWGSSPGVFDANHSNGARPPFTGPSLWSSDLTIYAEDPGPGKNGSHLDMLHGSPHCMGIAWETDNKYWVFDGQYRHPVMYDFAIDHGPGNSWHDDGRVRRYQEVVLQRSGMTPSHMALDKAKKWLYINNNGTGEILRMDITSGQVKGASSISAPERLAENVDVEGVTYETISSGDATLLCGLDVTDDRLLVSDHGKGEILVYDITKSGFPLLGKITVPNKYIMGIRIGPDGRIWYVDKLNKEFVRMDHNQFAYTGIQENAEQVEFKIYPAPMQDFLNIEADQSLENLTVTVAHINGQTVLEKNLEVLDYRQTLDVSTLESGLFVITISQENTVISRSKIIKQ